MSKLAVGGHPIYKTHLPKRRFGFVKSYWTLYEVNGTVKSYAQKRNQATEWNQSQRGLSICWLLKSRPSLTSQGRRSRYAYFLRASVNLQYTNTRCGFFWCLISALPSAVWETDVVRYGLFVVQNIPSSTRSKTVFIAIGRSKLVRIERLYADCVCLCTRSIPYCSFKSTMLPEELIFVYMTREEKTRSWMKEWSVAYRGHICYNETNTGYQKR